MFVLTLASLPSLLEGSEGSGLEEDDMEGLKPPKGSWDILLVKILVKVKEPTGSMITLVGE